MAANVITATFINSENGDPISVSGTIAGYSLNVVSGDPATILSISSAGSTRSFTISRDAVGGDVFTLDYDKSIGDSVSLSGGELQSFSGMSIDNNVLSPTPIGVIINYTSFADLSAFTNVGATVSVGSNALNFSGGNGGFGQSLQLNRVTNLEKWKITMEVKVTEKSGSSYGFGIAIKSVNSVGNITSITTLFQNYTGGYGTLQIYDGTNTEKANAASIFSYSVNDVIRLTLERDVLQFTFSSQNITTGSVINSCSYSYLLYSIGNPLLPNAGKPSIASFGGTFTVNNFKIESLENKNARIVVIGDSKTSGYNANSVAARFTELMKATYGDDFIVNYSGEGDGIDEYAQTLDDLTLLSPTLFLIMGISNTIRAGVSPAVYNPAYDSFVSNLELIARVVHTTGLKESVLDQSVFRTYVNANYLTANIIDTLPTTISVPSDGVHPDATGHGQVSVLLIASGKL